MPHLSPADHLRAQALFVDHQPWLLGRLHARLRNRAQAEDVASETFVTVIGQAGLAAIQEPRAFLTTVAKRVLYEVWRRRDLEQAYLDALAQLPEHHAPSAEDRALLLETLDGIARALDGLNDKARRAFLLSQLDGLTYLDIAAQLNVSHGMVRKYMAQGWRACALAGQA
ncbi:sigma-70 family RNA polymerase sigma factor [Sphingomonas sp. NCPPB 2930]